MSHGHGSGPNVPIDPNAKYELSDVQIGTLLPYVFGLFVFMAVSAVAGYGIYVLFVPRTGVRTTQFPLPTVRALPVEPRLQANPAEDIKVFRHDEDIAVHGYFKDPVMGNLHIPVEQAMDLVTQDGLPTRTDPGTMVPDLPNEPTKANGQTPTEPAQQGRVSVISGNPSGIEQQESAIPTIRETPGEADIPASSSGQPALQPNGSTPAVTPPTPNRQATPGASRP